MRAKMEAGGGMTEILIAGCGMKIGRWDRDMLHFVGGIGDRKSMGRIIILLKVRDTVFICIINGLH